MSDNFLHFLRILHLGLFFADQVELTKHIPLYSYFQVVTPPPYTAIFFLDPPAPSPSENTPFP